MKRLLISMLGGAPVGHDRPGHTVATYRLPGAGRIVETEHLGVDLARALQVDRLVLVGTASAYFDRLVDILDPAEQEAPVPEKAPESPKRAPEQPAAGTQDPPAAAGEAAPTTTTPEPEQTRSGPPSPSAATEQPPATTEQPPATTEQPPATTEQPPATPEQAATAPEQAASEPDPSAPTPARPEPVTGPETDAGPEPPTAREFPVAETAPGTPAAGEGADTDEKELPEPETVAVPIGGGEAQAATGEVPPAEAAPEPAEGETRAAAEAVRKHHEPDTRPLRERLAIQAQSGRADRGALGALGERLAKKLDIGEVRCLLVSAPTDDRSFQASLRNLVELPEKGDEVHLDVTYGEGLLVTVGYLAGYFLQRFRGDVKVADVLKGAPEHHDASGHAPVLKLSSPYAVLDWMETFDELKRGMAPAALHEIMNQDRRLQALAGPYVRMQRGVEFGAASEVVQGARLLEERRKRLSRLPYAHRYRIFDAVLGDAIAPWLDAQALSRVQLGLGRNALAAGQPGFAALHLREALLSHCLELFGQDPSRTWIDVPKSGGAQKVRMRDVASYVLGSKEVRERSPDLQTAWPLLADAKRLYINVSSGNVSASQLKNAEHEIQRLFHMVGELMERGTLVGIEEGRTFADVVTEAVDAMAVRPHEPRKRPRRRRGREGAPQERERGERREGGPPEREGGGPRGPRAGGGPRRRGPPREGRRGGPPSQGGGRRRGDERDREDVSPRVERLGGGIGNLGLALADAGVVESGGKPSNPKPPADGPPPADAAAATRPEEAAAPAPPQEAAAPEPPAAPRSHDGNARTGGDDAAPGQESAPPPQKPEAAPSQRERDAGEGGDAAFDVAGPTGPPPA